MAAAAFLQSAQPNKRELRKRIQLRLQPDGKVQALDLDRANIGTKKFPYLLSARPARSWLTSHELQDDLIAAAQKGEALVTGTVLETGLTGAPLPRTAICSDSAGSLEGLLPIDMDGVELVASHGDLLTPARLWRELLILLGMPPDSSGVLQITGSQTPLPATPAKVALRLRIYFLLQRPIQAASAKHWASRLPRELQSDASAYDKGRLLFLAPPRVYTSSMEEVADFLPRRFFAFGSTKVEIPDFPGEPSAVRYSQTAIQGLPEGGAVDDKTRAIVAAFAWMSLQENPVSPGAGGWHQTILAADWALISRMLVQGIRIDSATVAYAAQDMLAQILLAVESGRMIGRCAEELKAELSLDERQRSLVGAWLRLMTRNVEAPPIPDLAEDRWPTTDNIKASLHAAREALARHIAEAVSPTAGRSPGARLVEAPPGTGKTHACAAAAVERALAGDVVEVYGPQHRLLRELSERMSGLPDRPLIAHHVGRNHIYPDGVRACRRWPVIKHIVPRLGEHKIKTAFCQSTGKRAAECPFFQGCRYMDNEGGMKAANIRLLAHAALLVPFSIGEAEFDTSLPGRKNFRRRVMIVDETPKALETRARLTVRDLALAPPFLQWLHQAGQAGSVDLAEFFRVHGGYPMLRKCVADTIEALAPAVKVNPGMDDQEIRSVLRKALRAGPGDSLADASATRVRLWQFLKLLLRLVMMYPQGCRLSSVWTDAGGTLRIAMAMNLSDMPRLAPGLVAPTLLLVDATPDVPLIAATGARVDHRKIEVEDGLFKVQVINADWRTTQISPTKATRYGSDSGRREAWAGGRLVRLLWLRWAIQSCMQGGEKLLTVMPLSAKIDAGLKDCPDVLHFGALRGLDAFGDRPAVLVLGGPLPPLWAMVEAARIRYPGNLVEGVRHCANASTVSDALGRACTVASTGANVPAVDACMRAHVFDEITQAAHRLRPQHRPYKPVAFMVNDVPVRESVDVISDYDDLVPDTQECRAMLPMTALGMAMAPMSGRFLLQQMKSAGLSSLLGDYTTHEISKQMRAIDLASINDCLASVNRLLPPDVRGRMPPAVEVVQEAIAGSRGRPGRKLSCVRLNAERGGKS
jgi:hypothetical protein